MRSDAIPDSPPTINGARLAAIRASGTYRGRRPDLAAAYFPRRAAVAGVLTRSSMAAAPIRICRERLEGGAIRCLLVNAGNANALTGEQGVRAARESAQAAAQAFGCSERETLPVSTGKIGVPLDVKPLRRGVVRLAERMREKPIQDWSGAARAIMTTDTFPKIAWREISSGKRNVRVAGIAKGSGMIAPDMGTMLAFLFTDARLSPETLRRILRHCVERTFNCVSVDGDTSTNDAAFLIASGDEEATLPRGMLRAFGEATLAVADDLARMIARDGEGARKEIEIRVSGATSFRRARRVGRAIAASPLVKTAVGGGDPNWGRIAMAIGKSDPNADPDAVAISIGDEVAARRGAPVPEFNRRRAAKHLRGKAVSIGVSLGDGRGEAIVRSCDLTEDYVRINAEYS